MQETVKDMDDVVAEGIEEDDEGIDDLLAGLDEDLGKEQVDLLPEAGKKKVEHTPSPVVTTPDVPIPDVPIPDLNAELENLSFLC